MKALFLVILLFVSTLAFSQYSVVATDTRHGVYFEVRRSFVNTCNYAIYVENISIRQKTFNFTLRSGREVLVDGYVNLSPGQWHTRNAFTKCTVVNRRLELYTD